MGQGEADQPTDVSLGQKGAKSDSIKTVNGITKAVENVSIIETPKPKSKNLNVLAELEKTKQKPAANFVVIGESAVVHPSIWQRYLTIVHSADCIRPCRCREKYAHGPSALRSEDRRPKNT